jgi:uncharacterized protein (TIGR02268 family)
MRSQASAALLALFASASVAASPLAAPCTPGTRRIELTPEPSGELPALCIGPRLSTLLVFYGAELARGGVVVEGQERFTRVEVGDTVLRLEPSEKVTPGERFKVTVRFRDEALPTSVTLWLVVHPAWLEPLVEVHRQKRPVESCQQEVREKNAQLHQCQDENERLRTEKGVPEGLTGLLASGALDQEGIVSAKLEMSASPLVKDTLVSVMRGYCYRSQRRVVVELSLRVPQGQEPWLAGEAEFVGSGRRALRVLRTWQREPIGSGTKDTRVWIEAEATAEEARGTFTLTVWEARGPRSIVVTGVRFP